MFTDNVLRELLNYTSPDPVLSVYMNTDMTEGNADALKLRLRTLLKEASLPKDEAAILKYFELEREWTGRSVAMFSCAAQEYFRAFPIAVPVRSRVFVGNQPYVKPLADLLDAYGGYGVAVVDKQGARLFLFHLGELKEQEGIMGEEVRHTKRGGASSIFGRLGGIGGKARHSTETITRNLKESAEFAARFFEENHVRRILIGGTDKNVNQFKNHLPKTWQSLMVGSFPVSMTAKPADVQKKALEIGQQAERRREERLVEKMITSAAKGAEGVVRLDDTLSAVHEGRVQTLIVQEGFRAKGFQCQGCGYLTTQELEACPFCGKSFTQINDAVEMAVRKVMQDGGDVEIVYENPKLKDVGIGGMLRY
jgi:peptide subunit release factor 1 (eRF1)